MDYAALRGLAVASLVIASVTLAPARAEACGGFFCDNVDPVVQTAERILFRVNGDGTITTFVEVQYQGPPSNFGWVVPIAHAIDPADITVAPAGLFDETEAIAAPVFHEPDEGGAALADEGSGCDGFGGEGGGDYLAPDTSGVHVVGAAVVGPYAIEIITAESGENLTNWLQVNSYQIPFTAAAPMQRYVDMGMAFLGVKLTADAPAGPIDALVFDYAGPYPVIPLSLTAIAASPDMEIIAYVSAPARYVPGNYAETEFDYDMVSWTGEGETDFDDQLRAAFDDHEDGRALLTEYARPLAEDSVFADSAIARELLPRTDTLVRFHSYMDPEDMVVDPYFVMDVSAPVVDNHHTLGYRRGRAPAAPLDVGGLLPLALVVLCFRRGLER